MLPGLAGDFTGDGKADIVASYGYANSQSKLFVFTSAGSGFAWPVQVFDYGVGGGNLSNAKATAGDFTGDGKADVAAFYSYPGSQTKLFVFSSTGSGFAWPTPG